MFCHFYVGLFCFSLQFWLCNFVDIYYIFLFSIIIVHGEKSATSMQCSVISISHYLIFTYCVYITTVYTFLHFANSASWDSLWLLCRRCPANSNDSIQSVIWWKKKLAKLGDAIAISKSETINDPLTHPLTDWQG